MDELERLYNELPYFDKQKFIGRHLADARQEDIDKKFSGAFDYSEEDEVIRMEAIEEALTDELKEELECRGYIVTKARQEPKK